LIWVLATFAALVMVCTQRWAADGGKERDRKNNNQGTYCGTYRGMQLAPTSWALIRVRVSMRQKTCGGTKRAKGRKQGIAGLLCRCDSLPLAEHDNPAALLADSRASRRSLAAQSCRGAEGIFSFPGSQFCPSIPRGTPCSRRPCVVSH